MALSAKKVPDPWSSPTFLLPEMPKISLICLAVKNYVPVFTQQATGASKCIGKEGAPAVTSTVISLCSKKNLHTKQARS